MTKQGAPDRYPEFLFTLGYVLACLADEALVTRLKEDVNTKQIHLTYLQALKKKVDALLSDFPSG